MSGIVEMADRCRKRHHSDSSDDYLIEEKESRVTKRRKPYHWSAGEFLSKNEHGVVDGDEFEPSSVHTMMLGNNAKVVIEFFYDPEKISLDDVKFVKSLDDLSFNFTRILTHKDYVGTLPTVFSVEIGDRELTLFDHNLQSARVRVGPTLSHHLGTSTVIFQGTQQLELAPDCLMRVYAKSGTRDHFHALRDDISAFSTACGTRGITVLSPQPQNTAIPTEVAGLFSDYFYNIFYNESFKESQEQFVEIHDANADTINMILLDTVTRHDRWYSSTMKMNWHTVMNFLTQCDRFLMFRQSYNFQQFAKIYLSKIARYAKGTVRCMQEVSVVVRNNELMIASVNRHILPECLDKWEAEYAEEINPEYAEIIEKRKIQLQELCEKRPKLRFLYDGGANIVCSLFIDCHPILVKSLITSSLLSRRHDDKNIIRPPIIHFPERLDKDNAKNVVIYHPPGRHYLMYFDCFRLPQLRITDRIYGNGWVMGVVIEGTALLNVYRGDKVQLRVERQ